MQTSPALLVRAVTAALAFAFGAAQAAGDPDPPTPDKLSAVRARIAEKQWPAAIEALKSVDDKGSAEWNNLMGYALRKQATPDYAGAERHYEEALRLDPKHRGALEYSGELYLITGNLPKAEERLARLDKACLFSCEEYRDLKRAIERYKAAGNRYVASPES
jgi:tetratricopeptide (TPR) repeat protein